MFRILNSAAHSAPAGPGTSAPPCPRESRRQYSPNSPGRAFPRRRGSSRGATRSLRYFRIRRAACLSSARRSFSTRLSNSILQLKSAPHLVHGYRLPASLAVVNQALLGQVDIFKLLQVLQDRFSSVIAPVALARAARRFSTSSGNRKASMSLLSGSLLYKYSTQLMAPRRRSR